MPKNFLFQILLTLVIFSHHALRADVIIFHDGKVLAGNVLQYDEAGALLQLDYGTFRYPLSLIKDVKKEPLVATTSEPTSQRIPPWVKIISALATNSWAHELKQIPATVIDNGVLKDVPYLSFRCNTGGYELNIYGDLDHPSGLEIGATTYLVKSAEAKSNCLNFIASLLPKASDKNVITTLTLNQKNLSTNDGLTIETTLPNEPDAYGGWWVSAYDENLLAKARATGAELLTITQPIITPKPLPVVPAPPAVVTPATWGADDLSYSRPSSSSSSGGGRVYVRGYQRKNGTYVHSYTRSSPHRR